MGETWWNVMLLLMLVASAPAYAVSPRAAAASPRGRQAVVSTRTPASIGAPRRPKSVETLDGPHVEVLLQAWGIDDTSACRNGQGCLDFRARRAQIAVSGSYGDKARGFLMVDPAKLLKVSGTGTLSTGADTSILQDIGVAFALAPGLEIVLGQFLLPTFAEGLVPVNFLSLPEQSLPARTFGFRREPSLGLFHQAAQSPFKAAAVFANGQGPNRVSPKSSKDLHVRLDWAPRYGWSFGGFTSLGQLSYRHRAAWGANVGYTDSLFTFRLEGAYGVSSGVRTLGGVVELGYRFTPVVQGVIRAEALLPDTSQGDLLGQAVTLGLNVFVVPDRAKIQFALTSMNKMAGDEGTTFVDPGQARQTLAIMAFQVEF